VTAVNARHWGTCRVCKRERRLKRNGHLAEHNRWNPVLRIMVACEGAGVAPVPEQQSA
jgi:hypothetical protein